VNWAVQHSPQCNRATISKADGMKRLVAFFAVVLGANAALADDLPDSAKTPGAILETVPDEQVASCLSDKIGTNI
jgi:hypothetical protein